MFNPSTHSLVLRACNEDMSSKNDFKWPTSGVVECPDWDPVPECGKGLHGWLYGNGDGSASEYWSFNDKWLVVSVETSSIIQLDGKIKFPKGEVVFCGDRKSATDFLMKHEPRSKDQPIIGAFVIVGDNETVNTGYKGTSTSGDYGTSTSGDFGTSTSGYYGISTSGDYGTSTSSNSGKSTSGDFGTSTSGYYGISTSGYYGTSTSSHSGTSTSSHSGTSSSGNFGTSTSGNYSTSTSGYKGTSISGDYGTSTSGVGGKCLAGVNGMISIYYSENNRKKLKVGYIGEDGLEPDTFYKLDENNNFVKCE